VAPHAPCASCLACSGQRLAQSAPRPGAAHAAAACARARRARAWRRRGPAGPARRLAAFACLCTPKAPLRGGCSGEAALPARPAEQARADGPRARRRRAWTTGCWTSSRRTSARWPTWSPTSWCARARHSVLLRSACAAQLLIRAAAPRHGPRASSTGVSRSCASGASRMVRLPARPRRAASSPEPDSYETQQGSA